MTSPRPHHPRPPPRPLRVTLPTLTDFRPIAAVITVVALVLVFALRWPMLRILATCAGLGVLAALVGLPVT